MDTDIITPTLPKSFINQYHQIVKYARRKNNIFNDKHLSIDE